MLFEMRMGRRTLGEVRNQSIQDRRRRDRIAAEIHQAYKEAAAEIHQTYEAESATSVAADLHVTAADFAEADLRVDVTEKMRCRRRWVDNLNSKMLLRFSCKVANLKQSVPGVP
jgi:hypothetical protein